MTKICPTCRRGIHTSDALYCYADGTALKESTIHSCGYELADYHAFCPKCGKSVKEDATADGR